MPACHVSKTLARTIFQSCASQVLEWTQTILRVGEAFSGEPCTALRDAVQRQSGHFFQAFHSSNMLSLHSILENELWSGLPVDAAR